MGKKGTGKVLKTCLCCGLDFYARNDRLGKYCSRSCSSKSRPSRDHKIDLKCTCCGAIYKVKLYRKETSFFCSRICLAKIRGLKMRKENHHFWNGGISERTHSSRYEIKKRKKEVGKCEICGSKDRLEGHHVNGYKNDRECLKILCVDCHGNEHPKLAEFMRGKYVRKMDPSYRNEERCST